MDWLPGGRLVTTGLHSDGWPECRTGPVPGVPPPSRQRRAFKESLRISRMIKITGRARFEVRRFSLTTSGWLRALRCKNPGEWFGRRVRKEAPAHQTAQIV